MIASKLIEKIGGCWTSLEQQSFSSQQGSECLLHVIVELEAVIDFETLGLVLPSVTLSLAETEPP